jgi:hypothetical protein
MLFRFHHYVGKCTLGTNNFREFKVVLFLLKFSTNNFREFKVVLFFLKNFLSRGI